MNASKTFHFQNIKTKEKQTITLKLLFVCGYPFSATTCMKEKLKNKYSEKENVKNRLDPNRPQLQIKDFKQNYWLTVSITKEKLEGCCSKLLNNSRRYINHAAGVGTEATKVFKNIGATAIARRLRADDLFEASNYSARKFRSQLVSRDHMIFHCIMPKQIQIGMPKCALKFFHKNTQKNQISFTILQGPVIILLATEMRGPDTSADAYVWPV